MSAPSSRARSWMARLAPYALVVTALPLLAPTCGGQQPGPKAFSKGSLIIPMDACYQNTPTTLTNATYFTPYAGCPSNGGTTSDHGNVLRAYGLVYQLLRNNIPVYWVINSAKVAPSSPANSIVDTLHPDIAISYAAGPVGKYAWASDTFGGMPPNNTGTSISYQGGPFVVDGSDAAAARVVMQSLGTTFQTVNVHASNVAFGATVARAMSGNFSNSGGSTPPPIALLNITGGDSKNSEPVIQGYLVNAGLGPSDFAGAGGTATPTGHGKIYDDLYPADFLPTTCSGSCANGSACSGGQCAPNLVAYGYSILWVPHWCGPGSETKTQGGPTFPAGTDYRNVLTAIRAYLNGGHDVMAECASLGTFEGVNNSNVCSGSATGYPAGTPAPATQVQTQGGVNINEKALSATVLFLPTPSPAPATAATPFLQLGDFPFTPVTGAIQQFRSAPSPYSAGLVRLIGDSADNTEDYFTWLPASAPRGTLVYLSGHDYSGGQSPPAQIAGSRLVLNTLFNLGNSCSATHAACTAQALGICAAGTRECCSQADVNAGLCQNVGDPFCKPGTPQPETCNGLDDDCDGIVDNHLTDAQATTATACYPGATPGCTQGAPGVFTCQGVCHPGAWSCSSGAWTCVGAGTPGTEICNGLDDDCNGTVDDNLTPPGGVSTCYTGPTGTANVGLCRSGTWACVASNWTCTGQVLPAQERCEGVLQDYNCNGIAGDGCDCVIGTSQPCAYPSFPGYTVTPGIGICRTGTQTCVNSGGRGVWGACSGQVLPNLVPPVTGVPTEICGNGLDDDCNGIIDDPAVCNCTEGATQTCYPAATAGCVPKSGSCAAGTVEKDGMCCTGVCAPGVRVCVGGQFSSACTSAVTPAPAEKCNGRNDTCSGSWANDDGAPCPTLPGQPSQACVNGVCIIPTIPTEGQCACGYQRTGASAPYTCVAPSCPSAPCPAGTLCLMADGSCPAPGTIGTTCIDPCANKVCGDGAYCSGGACVGGGCTATGCTGPDAGKLCRNGSCQADPCASVTCPAGTFARGNFGQSPPVCDCVRPCATVVCPQGQACGADGFCAPDPCATVTCATGKVCKAGSCVADPCPPGTCGQNQICSDGLCTDDPCAGTGAIQCPVGTCIKGQCQDPANPAGYGPPPAPAATTKSGCGCGGGEAGTGSLLLALLGLPLARRRRPRASPDAGTAPRALGPAARGRRPGFRGAAILGIAALLALGGAACGKSKTEKPNCETCGGDSCVDLRTSAGNCGSCGHACGAGQTCGAGTCVAAAVVPVITAVAPSATTGVVLFTVTGSGFSTGAGTKVRVAGAVPQAELDPAPGATTTQLQATVDLSAVEAGTLTLQVVNVDRTNSNLFAIEVVTPTPQITSLTPGQGAAGTVVPVVVAGIGFTSNAVCVQKAGTVETVIVPTAKSATSLSCALDLTHVTPGFIDVMVQNENRVRSAAKQFEATSPGPPTITSLSPNAAAQGSETNLLVSGSAFEPASSVEIGPGTPGTATTWTPLVTTYVYSTSLRAALSLKSYAAGAYQVHVVNTPGGTSAAAAFTVSATAPVASNLTVTPATPVLGQTGVQLALSGSSFSPGCTLELAPPPLSTFRTASSTTFVSPQLLQGTADLNAAGDTSGTWAVRANCGGTRTAALPFAVVSNQASLVSATPAGGAQGQAVSVALAGSNFLGFGTGMTVTLDGLNPVPATLGSSTAATATLSLAGVATGVHLLRAVNAGAPPSNPIAFSVTPGTPAIASVTVADSAGNGACSPTSNCSSCASPATCANPGACAVQQAKNVLVTVTGSNFGSGVSTVFVSSVLTGKVDLSTVLAAGSVVIADASTIRVTLDTTSVVAGQTYTLTVENPGKPPSNAVAFKVSTSTCP